MTPDVFSTPLELVIEKAVAGGRMLARHDGRIVLVAGAIPGERVRVRVERQAKHLLFATVTDVMEGSPHRRAPFCDARCGGLAYAHIALDYQPALKASILADAFRRIAGVTVPAVTVASSPEESYRLRARLHVRDRAVGFFLEGSHSLCDAAATRQLRPEVIPTVYAVLARVGAIAAMCEAVVVSENVEATERVCHLELKEGARIPRQDGALELPAGVTGITVGVGARTIVLGGQPTVTEHAGELFGGASPIDPSTRWVRSAASFFQGNRFLTGRLLAHVLSEVDDDHVVDAYAGVGLFAVALAARGARVIAIEDDRGSGADLETNAQAFGGAITVWRAPVEEALPAIAPGTAGAVVLDPPRSGTSAEALAALIRLEARRLVYVSCDPATLARDAKRLIAAGYRLGPMAGFDLFPNTSHVETVAVFDRG
jgi:23S rRNA (uracil1939-C5)-methyltransferase